MGAFCSKSYDVTPVSNTKVHTRNTEKPNNTEWRNSYTKREGINVGGTDTLTADTVVVNENGNDISKVTPGEIPYHDESPSPQEEYIDDTDETDTRKGLYTSDLTDNIFREVCRKIGTNYISWKQIENTNGSISSTVYGGDDSAKITGVIFIELTCEEQGEEKQIKVVLKSKVHARETAVKYTQMASMAGPETGIGMQKFIEDPRGSFSRNHLVEPTMAHKAMTDEVIGSISPEVYFVRMNENREQYFFIMEYLDRDKYSHINTITQPGIDFFDEDATKKALQGIAIFHGAFLDRPARWKDYIVSDFLELSIDYPEVFRGWAQFNLTACPEILTETRAPLYQKLVNNFEKINGELRNCKKTLVHNDFTPLNTCLRQDPGAGKQDLCAYDWEVMSISVPQRDIIDFLSFGLMMAPPDVALMGFKGYLEYYRHMLHHTISGRDDEFIEAVTSEENFYKTVDYAFMLHMLERFANFMMISKVMPMPFLPMMANFLFSYLESIVDKYDFLQ